MVSVEDDDLAGLEDVSSDADDNYEAELSDGENSAGTTPVRKPYRKRTRVDNPEQLPLMEGEGRSFRVMGFNQSQRAQFVQILMRFGVGDFDWAEFTPRLKQKSFEEIHAYGALFLSHIAEEITDAPTFSDGVPKEGLRIEDVLVRIAVLLLVRDKVKFSMENPDAPLFTDEIISRYPGLRGLRFWKEEHDRTLLRAVLKHGYGRWQAIVDDKDLRVQEVIHQELNLPVINLPVPGASQAQVVASGGFEAQGAASAGSQAQDTANITNAETTGHEMKVTAGGNDAAQGATNAANRTQVFQDSPGLYHYREMQRRLVEFVKKRVLLLEKGLNAEYQKEYFGEEKENEVRVDDTENEAKVVDRTGPSHNEICSVMIDYLPKIEVISPEEIAAAACDDNPGRLEMARLYNEMCKVLEENAVDSVEAYLANKPSGFKLRKNLLPLEAIYQDVNKILSPAQPMSQSSSKETVTEKPTTSEKAPQTEPVMENGKSNGDVPCSTSPQYQTSSANGIRNYNAAEEQLPDAAADSGEDAEARSNEEKQGTGVIVLE